MTDREDSRMRFAWIAVLLLCIVGMAVIFIPMKEPDELSFHLKQVSVLDLAEDARREFLIGQRATLRAEADPNLTACPLLKSDQPVYGEVDSSDPLGEMEPSMIYHFALDESGGTGTGYDRLYFDRNQDRDLTNDAILSRQKDPPQGATPNYSDVKQHVCFENLQILFPCGEVERPLEMMPQLTVFDSGYKSLNLVTMKARTGRVEIAGQKYDIALGHCYLATGWFDEPWTALHLTPAGARRHVDWWGGDRLNAMHKIAEAFYSFSATPTGDKLIVRPYKGPLGTFEVGAGGRSIDRFEIKGSLRSEKTVVAVGELTSDSRLRYARSWRVPAGDYLPEYVTLEYGTLRISISNNYHSDGKLVDLKNRPFVYGVHVRENEPFLFDFSNEPAVMFASPARDHRVKPGEEVSVMAVLIDPVLDFMIRGLTDTSRRQERKSPFPDSDRRRPQYEDVSLDPGVTITRADGEIVAEGVMPFG